MSKVLTSLGVRFAIGERRNKDYSEPSQIIPQVIESSEFDLDPDTIDTTSFDNINYKSSVAGLIDTTGIQSLTVNATESEDAETLWDFYAGRPAWLKIIIPNKEEDNTYIPIVPIKTGAYNLTVNDRITIRLKYTVAGDMVFGASLSEAVADASSTEVEDTDYNSLPSNSWGHIFSGGKYCFYIKKRLTTNQGIYNLWGEMPSVFKPYEDAVPYGDGYMYGYNFGSVPMPTDLSEVPINEDNAVFPSETTTAYCFVAYTRNPLEVTSIYQWITAAGGNTINYYAIAEK